MQYSNSFIATFVAALACSPLVSATVYLGVFTNGEDGSQSQVAWTNGVSDVCDSLTTIVSGTNNPCGHPFQVQGGSGSYEFQGCGGTGLSLTDNGSFNSNCKSQSKKISCPAGAKIQQAWSCS